MPFGIPKPKKFKMPKPKSKVRTSIPPEFKANMGMGMKPGGKPKRGAKKMASMALQGRQAKPRGLY